MEDLLGKEIKGFKFSGGVGYNMSMNKYIYWCYWKNKIC